MMPEHPETNRVERFFANLKRRARRLLHVISWLVLLFLIAELVSFSTLRLYRAFRADDEFAQGSPDDPRKHIDIYADADWADAYFDEFAASYRTAYFSYTGYRRLPFSGRYINIDSLGLRRTTPDCGADDADPLLVFFFGGSAAWGTGARDEATIPSHLARELCDLGIAATVTNFGESGYTNSQELIELQLELRDGHVPGVAIFYDGVNDVYSSYQNGVAGQPQNVANRILAHELTQRPAMREALRVVLFTNTGQLLKKIASYASRLGSAAAPNGDVASDATGHDSALDRATVETLIGNQRVVQALEREYGFESFFYWQPAVYNKDLLSEDERTKVAVDSAFAEMYLRVTELIGSQESITDLSDILDAFDRSFFLDEFHISEEGNGIVAGAILEDVLEHLRSTGRWPRAGG